jgi:hypothetical protein
MGCEGGSLGYHLATGNDGRSVCTLHGSLDNLLMDLQGSFFANYHQEIAVNRRLIQTKQIETLLASRGRIAFGEVMSLRIVHPTPNAVVACAIVLGGTVPCDSQNNAIYPNTYSTGGSIALPASCAIIIELLETMKRLDSRQSSSSTSTSIRFCEIRKGVLF